MPERCGITPKSEKKIVQEIEAGGNPVVADFIKKNSPAFREKSFQTRFHEGKFGEYPGENIEKTQGDTTKED